MSRPTVNYDAALQYAGSSFPLAEAVARGRQDFLDHLQSGKTSVNPYKTHALRSAWMQGYECERVEFGETIQR